MKIERVDSQTFKIDATSLVAGDYIVRGNDSKGTLSLFMKNGGYSLPVFTDKLWSSFTDASDDEFASYEDASAYLASAIAAGDGVSSIISDKGTVTQATSITTGVTLNARNGIITTVSSTLAADTEATFTVTNSAVVAGSNVIPSVIYPAASAGTPVVNIGAIADGSFTVVLTNVNPSNALNAAVKIGFVVL